MRPRAGTRAVLAAALAGPLLLCAACGSGGNGAARSSAQPPAGPATAGSAAAGPSSSGSATSGSSSGPAGAATGADAETLGRSVPGCSGLHAESPAPGLHAQSAATCVLRGHQVEILTFRNAGQQRAARATASAEYSAQGAGWLVLPAPGETIGAQQSSVQDVALALDGTVNTPTSG